MTRYVLVIFWAALATCSDAAQHFVWKPETDQVDPSKRKRCEQRMITAIDQFGIKLSNDTVVTVSFRPLRFERVSADGVIEMRLDDISNRWVEVAFFHPDVSQIAVVARIGEASDIVQRDRDRFLTALKDGRSIEAADLGIHTTPLDARRAADDLIMRVAVVDLAKWVCVGTNLEYGAKWSVNYEILLHGRPSDICTMHVNLSTDTSLLPLGFSAGPPMRLDDLPPCDVGISERQAVLTAGMTLTNSLGITQGDLIYNGARVALRRPNWHFGTTNQIPVPYAAPNTNDFRWVWELLYNRGPKRDGGPAMVLIDAKTGEVVGGGE